MAKKILTYAGLQRFLLKIKGIFAPISHTHSKSEIIDLTSDWTIVNHGTSDTVFTLTPNVLHVWDAIDTTLILSLGGGATMGQVEEYMFKVTAGGENFALSLPANIRWTDGAPVFTQGNIYEVSIVDNLAICCEFMVK